MALDDGFVDLKTVRLESISCMTEALELAVRGSGVAPKAMADRLGIGYDHMCRMFRRHDSRHFPQDLLEALMRECKSTLPLEWLAWRMGYRLHEKSLGLVLEAIRDALLADGRAPKFSIHEHGRVEPAG